MSVAPLRISLNAISVKLVVWEKWICLSVSTILLMNRTLVREARKNRIAQKDRLMFHEKSKVRGSLNTRKVGGYINFFDLTRLSISTQVVMYTCEIQFGEGESSQASLLCKED